MMVRTFAAALLLSLPAASAAQVRDQPIDEVAADLAFGFCPLFLAGQFSLTGPELAERGFGKTVSKQPHPRVGEMSLVESKRPDGSIAFGGAAGKACTVVVGATDRAAVLARLRKNMAFMGLDFQPTANVGPEIAGLKVETFKAPVDSQMLYVQLVQAEAPVPTVTAQLFAMDK
ncbi:MAG TPA: hypothetical protein VF759_10895 [Allosphingosinicella sp.]|jgi:hypothetical protein